MRATIVGSVELDVCTSCRGVFFDVGELRRHLKTGRTLEEQLHRAAGDRGKSSSAGPCMKCGGAFSTLATASGDVHVCGRCDGVLLAHDVLQRAPKEGVLPLGDGVLAARRGTRGPTDLSDSAVVGLEVGAGVLEIILEVVLELVDF